MARRNCDYNKVAIVGAGKVGMTAAYALLLDGIANEIVLFGRDASKLTGERLDLEHAMALTYKTKIVATDDYEDLRDTDVVVFSAGAAQLPGESRLDLVGKNVKIMETMLPPIMAVAPRAIVLMVANPVDILTYRAIKMCGVPEGQIFGSGTTLDTARFRFHLSEFLPVNPRSIHTYVLGEHGDSSFPLISSASVGGQSLSSFPGFSKEKAQDAYQKARDAAAEIINSKGATYYGIGAAVTTIVRAILRGAQTVLPVSVLVHDYYGVDDICLSLPAIIDRSGASEVIKPSLDETEQEQLRQSAASLREFLT
ncbi:MAG: L-lactate dehydrogenase [bacterium]|nr:L-lactate dehydrogenase [bacterium]